MYAVSKCSMGGELSGKICSRKGTTAWAGDGKQSKKALMKRDDF